MWHKKIILITGASLGKHQSQSASGFFFSFGPQFSIIVSGVLKGDADNWVWESQPSLPGLPLSPISCKHLKGG